MHHAHARGIKAWLDWLVDERDLRASPMRRVASPKADRPALPGGGDEATGGLGGAYPALLVRNLQEWYRQLAARARSLARQRKAQRSRGGQVSTGVDGRWLRNPPIGRLRVSVSWGIMGLRERGPPDAAVVVAESNGLLHRTFEVREEWGHAQAGPGRRRRWNGG